MIGFDVDLFKMAQVEVVELRQEISNKIDAYTVVDPSQSTCLQYLSKPAEELDLSDEIYHIENPDPTNTSATIAAVAAVLAVKIGLIVNSEYELMNKGFPECRGVEEFDDLLAKYRTVKWRVLFVI